MKQDPIAPQIRLPLQLGENRVGDHVDIRIIIDRGHHRSGTWNRRSEVEPSTAVLELQIHPQSGWIESHRVGIDLRQGALLVEPHQRLDQLIDRLPIGRRADRLQQPPEAVVALLQAHRRRLRLDAQPANRLDVDSQQLVRQRAALFARRQITLVEGDESRHPDHHPSQYQHRSPAHRYLRRRTWTPMPAATAAAGMINSTNQVIEFISDRVRLSRTCSGFFGGIDTSDSRFTNQFMVLARNEALPTLAS